MNDQEETTTYHKFFERVLEESKKEDVNPLIIYKIIAEELFADLEELKNERLFKAYDFLESKTGKLPIFNLADRLPVEEKHARYLFFLNDIIKSTFQLVGIGAQITLKHNESFWQSLKKDFIQFAFRGKLEDIINRYIIEWEVLYNTFVSPGYDRLCSKKIIPPKPKGSGRYGEINALIQYFNTSEILKVFNPLLECMETELRNSLVHLNYWIDSEKNLIYYYNMQKDNLKVKTYKIGNLCEKLVLLLVFKFVYIIRIANSLT